MDSILVFPAFVDCTTSDSRTLTYTSQLPHRTGFEVVGGGDTELAYWNDAGAVWVVSVESGYAIQDLGFEPSIVVTTAINEPDSTAFTLTVPLKVARICILHTPPA